MTDCAWIVCERSGRWAAALRMAMGRRPMRPTGKWQLHEVRSLEELASRLAERPCAVALVEVRRTNLPEILAWLADAGATYPSARCVALLDSAGFDREVRSSLTGALVAAGAVEISDSPRYLDHVLIAGRRHAALQARKPTCLDTRQSFAEWAWARLPWQPT